MQAKDKETKPRAEQYNEKLKVNTNFFGLITAAAKDANNKSAKKKA